MSSASANVPFPLNRAPSRTKFLSLILATLHKTMVRCVACFGSLLFVGSICAQSLNIAASSAQYTTYVWARDDSGPPISRTTISSSPISDAIVIPIRGGIMIRDCERWFVRRVRRNWCGIRQCLGNESALVLSLGGPNPNGRHPNLRPKLAIQRRFSQLARLDLQLRIVELQLAR